MNSSEFFIKALENESVEYIFGVPGEENIHLMDALLDSNIRFILTRHEQGAAFMADVYGRLTGKAGVCFSTLGPGATNLITGFADANMDKVPIVAVAGQGSTTRMHKESHQILNLVRLFEPISKYSVGIRTPEVIPEVISKAFKVAQIEKPGGCFIDFPENIAASEMPEEAQVLAVEDGGVAAPQEERIQSAARIIAEAKFPVVLIGNGVIRAGACDQLLEFIDSLKLIAANTFMAKGAIPSSHELSIGTVGLQSKDYAICGFVNADVVICVGYDIVEYHPYLWHPDKDKKIVHIDTCMAEVDAHYSVACEVVGDIGESLKRLTVATQSSHTFKDNLSDRKAQASYSGVLKQMIDEEFEKHIDDDSYPLKPQNILWQLRQVLGTQDIVLSDVGAHKMWIARMYQAEAPNTCIISNGFASMGISVPGALAAKLVYPDRNVVAVTGDAGFMMNSQEIETALREKTAFVILIWQDQGYGLIKWHQLKEFGRDSHIDFTNPDFVKYAESFGAKGFRIESAERFQETMREALTCGTVAVVDCPVDYSVNMGFTEKMGRLVCPI